MPQNEYVSFPSEIKEVIQHTQIEYTFRMAYEGKIKPGQFFEVSMRTRLARKMKQLTHSCRVRLPKQWTVLLVSMSWWL